MCCLQCWAYLTFSPQEESRTEGEVAGTEHVPHVRCGTSLRPVFFHGLCHYKETYIRIFVSFFGSKKLTSGQIKEESVDQVLVTMSDSVSDLGCVLLL